MSPETLGIALGFACGAGPVTVEESNKAQAACQNSCSTPGKASPPDPRSSVQAVVNFPAIYDFGVVLNHIKCGGRAVREGWNGRGMYIALQSPDKHSKMGLPYIYLKTARGLRGGGELVPWLASQTDLLSSDWALMPNDYEEMPF